MTVTGIWTHMTKHATEVTLNDLRHKCLSVDGHIWLYESMRGSSSHGASGASYLVTFFSRCQRLLEHGIEPIVVFDCVGPSPSTSSDYSERDYWRSRKKRRCGIAGQEYTNNELTEKVTNAQELIRSMGIRCIIATGDGEAQCAQLELAGLTQGCITTDFDYLLFGGSNLYKVAFNNGGRNVSDDVLHLSLHNLDEKNHFSRNRLIALAMLLGCDYSERGVGKVGMVTALEIISEFTEPIPSGDDDHPITILDRFASCYRQDLKGHDGDNDMRKKLRKKIFDLPDGFPNADVYQFAVDEYLVPQVFHHDESTIGVKPESHMDEVRNILSKECGWQTDRFKEEIERVSKRKLKIRRETTQTKLTSFFARTRRVASVLEPCSQEEKTNCSRREWDALRYLREKNVLSPGDARGFETDLPDVNEQDVREMLRKLRQPSPAEDEDPKPSPDLVVLDVEDDDEIVVTGEYPAPKKAKKMDPSETSSVQIIE